MAVLRCGQHDSRSMGPVSSIVSPCYKNVWVMSMMIDEGRGLEVGDEWVRGVGEVGWPFDEDEELAMTSTLT